MERDVPQPDPGEALLRVAYTTLNPLDIFIRQGRVPWMAGKFPFTPGMEFSGIVEKIGAGVDPKWVGARRCQWFGIRGLRRVRRNSRKAA